MALEDIKREIREKVEDEIRGIIEFEQFLPIKKSDFEVMEIVPILDDYMNYSDYPEFYENKRWAYEENNNAND
jgi:hypothetical protein